MQHQYAEMETLLTLKQEKLTNVLNLKNDNVDSICVAKDALVMRETHFEDKLLPIRKQFDTLLEEIGHSEDELKFLDEVSLILTRQVGSKAFRLHLCK